MRTSQHLYACGKEKTIHRMLDLGFKRIVFLIEPGQPDDQWHILEQGAKLVREFR